MKWIKSHPWLTGLLVVLAACLVFFFYTDLHLLYRQRPTEFEAAITQDLADAKIPGAALLFMRDGQVESSKGYGLADVESGRGVDADTLFTVASVSKPVTATALMTLYEQGKFELDDDINDYLSFEVRNPTFADTPITFRMLLTHTSSIVDSSAYERFYTLKKEPVLPDSPISLEEFVTSYFDPQGEWYDTEENFLKEAPGVAYYYSNMGYGLIGYLVEQISGMPFNEYCKQAIFEPLGMEHSAWFFKDVDVNQVAVPYGYDDLRREPKPFGFYGYPTYPDGALKTSVNEYARFLSVFINEGRTLEGGQFLKPETVAEMLRTQSLLGIEAPAAVGFAWHYDGESYLHTGGDPGISTLVYFNPEADRAVIFFTNGGGEYDVPGVLRLIFVDSKLSPMLLEKMNAP
ncbi:MAG TPA: serine hydrolase domain-containing protein [Anaerolineales bacterium]|nr:serine hydrolase domain-containing protein [Anaerolineales bacterium]